jgi:hypothetical protein
MTARVVSLEAREASLKRKLRAHFKVLGFTKSAEGLLVPPGLTKDLYRQVHSIQRATKLHEASQWLRAQEERLIGHFANGIEVDPERIAPRIDLVTSGTSESDLFRFASLTWQIPVSSGYGRRIRFVVRDDANGKLIGIFALGDAVFNLRARDAAIGWDHEQRAKSLVHIMDAYVLGAVPPYNMLLGGKLVASLVKTQEVVDAFKAKYRSSVGIISGERKSPRLAVVTTTSAFGKSSVYNRLRLRGDPIFESLGYTSGWGHFHFSEALFDEMREFLAAKRPELRDSFEFGQGPNWRLRIIKQALSQIGLDRSLAQHGMEREVFLCRIGRNAYQFLRGEHSRLQYEGLKDVDAMSALVRERWMIPRAARMPEYREWRREGVLQLLGSKMRAIGSAPAVSGVAGGLVG